MTAARALWGPGPAVRVVVVAGAVAAAAVALLETRIVGTAHVLPLSKLLFDGGV